MSRLSKRNTNVEILRIFAMFLIVLSHYVVHSGVINTELPLGFSRFLFEVGSLGNIGVILFVLITGYYSIGKSNPFKLKKLMSIICQVLFYSMTFYSLFCALGMEHFSAVEFIRNLFPITFKQYWFVTVFVVLYIMAPYINILLNNLSRKRHLQLLAISLVLFSVFPTLTAQSFYGNELIQFILFYSVGAYLRKYKDNFFYNRKNAWFMLIGCSLIIVASIIVFDLLGTHWAIFGKYSKYLLNRNSIVSIMLSISLFSLFIKKKPFTNNIINKVAGCAFGVYIISDNCYVRNVLWTSILSVPNFANSPILILHLIGSVLIVYLVCSVIEFIRLNTLERLFSSVYDSIEQKIKKWLYIKKKKLL